MKNKNEQENSTHYLPLYMCIGLSIGLALGSASNNIPVGMCIGLGVGTCLGGFLDRQTRKKKNDGETKKDNETEDTKDE